MMQKVTVIVSGVCYVEDVAYRKKEDAIEHLVNDKGCAKIDKHDVYANSELVFMLKELEVR